MKILIAFFYIFFLSEPAPAMESRCFLRVFYDLSDGSILADQIPIDKLIKKSKGMRNSKWKLGDNMRPEDIPSDMFNELSIQILNLYSSAYIVMNLETHQNGKLETNRQEDVISTAIGATKRIRGDGMSFDVICNITKME